MPPKSQENLTFMDQVDREGIWQDEKIIQDKT